MLGGVPLWTNVWREEVKLLGHEGVKFFTRVRVAKLLEFWPPVVACVLGLGAVLADLLWDQFRVFALDHAMITAAVLYDDFSPGSPRGSLIGLR